MYFNYPSEYILPNWLEENIVQTKKMIGKADKELKFGISESFESIPFNLVAPKILKEKLREVCERFCKAFEKAPLKNGEEDSIHKPWGVLGFDHYYFLLRDTFDYYPLGLLVKKGVSSSGKEALVICEDSPIPVFLFRTVYLLCWNSLNDKNKFSISKHPIYPLFHRYIQEPLSIAMTLAVINNVFGDESRAKDYVIGRIRSLPMNFTAGVWLYNSGVYLRWKDWRDNSNRCLDKIDIIREWIDLLSNLDEAPDNDQIISLWAELFDLTQGEVQGLKAASRYAPIVSENIDLSKLVLGLLNYAVKNPDDFKTEKVGNSRNPIAEVIYQLVCKHISLEDALRRLPLISNEGIIRDFIGNVMTGWSFAQDLHDGCFRIYGPTIIAIAYSGVRDNEHSAPSRANEITNEG